MRELGVLEERIRDDGTAALKAGDKRRRSALSTFVAALKKERIDSGKAPSEADELTVLKRERKRRAEAIELYDQAGRTDLADQQRYEVQLLTEYMPEELGDEELEQLVDEAIVATESVTAKDMGKVMGWLKPRVAGRADGKRLSGLVREKLGG
jgi:uncharacterized protein YqeY